MPKDALAHSIKEARPIPARQPPDIQLRLSPNPGPTSPINRSLVVSEDTQGRSLAGWLHSAASQREAPPEHPSLKYLNVYHILIFVMLHSLWTEPIQSVGVAVHIAPGILQLNHWPLAILVPSPEKLTPLLAWVQVTGFNWYLPEATCNRSPMKWYLGRIKPWMWLSFRFEISN